MHTETLTYEADGLPMRSDLFFDESISGPRPGVLVFPEAFGLSEHARESAHRLAELGFVALACDIHGDAKIYPVSEIGPVLGPLRGNPSRIRARADGSLQALLGRAEVDPARVAAIGYCFGGTLSLELARGGADIVGVAGFHCGLGTADPADAKNIKAKVLVCLGADDPSIDAAQRLAFEQEMRGGGVDWQMTIYGGVVHSFTNPDAGNMGQPSFARYDARADARSWAEMLALFDEVFA